MPTYIVPTFSIVEAADVDEAIRIMADRQARAPGNELFYQDEALNPKRVSEEEYFSILDHYTAGEIERARRIT